ncbi:MAG: SUMF1/EgtB/PvdO family nonheme iron enzyme [Bacteroidales bacterium]|nr:SUMF1/EgtB/PvdO family nonheme iron enzyme [Bacteroidales bacterium]
MKRLFWLSIRIAGMLCLPVLIQAQEIRSVELNHAEKISVRGFISDTGTMFPLKTPLFSFRLNDKLVYSTDFQMIRSNDTLTAHLQNRLTLTYHPVPGFSPGWKSVVTLSNQSNDTLEITNVVPFGQYPDRVYLTGLGRHYLSRTHLFRPGLEPVNVIMPDNAWESGFCELAGKDIQVAALARRTAANRAGVRRFETLLFPGGSVTYTFYADRYEGVWQEGLRMIFQQRMLYDLSGFNDSLYQRNDLKWIRHSYASHLLYAWDHQFYESRELKNRLEEFIRRGKRWYGGDDFIGIWPTWPSLGLDQRNQWDLFRDLPGGLDALREIAKMCRSYGTRFFICYNPWDEDTRAENQYSGMADLIKQIGADGVVLDTRGSSSVELQRTADSVRKGVVMYSEGMAVPHDMQGIVAGRVHNALYYPPMLNLNKLIKPDFAIFRVAELAYEPIRREYATSLFNGYGTELNIFKPGRPDWIERDYRFFGQTLRILRENTDNFTGKDFTPLISTLHDRIYVNEWPGEHKTVFTIFSLIPEGFDGPLFEYATPDDMHWVDVWNHHELQPDTTGGHSLIPVTTDAFNHSQLGTNNEGAVGAVILFPKWLNVDIHIDRLTVSSVRGDRILIWAGDPDYEKKPLEIPVEEKSLKLGDYFGRYEGDFIIQLFEKNEILDERIVSIKPGTPRLISRFVPTPRVAKAPKGMVEIPAGTFTWKTTHGDEFIGYPASPYYGLIQMTGFYMDRYPVTNREYYRFIRAAGYTPSDTVNFLKHWIHGKPPRKLLNYPVVYVSYEDAQAYAQWAEKRLPSELEWQYAAQTPDLRPWPWGEEKGVSREVERITNTLTVKRIKGIDSTLCNLGNGMLDPVGSHPKGVNPYGLEDLVGSVWQLTNDEYDDGSYNFIMLKGGSYFNPSSSWWYVQGGPRELYYRQMLLRVSRGFERNATVGFRCVKDKL